MGLFEMVTLHAVDAQCAEEGGVDRVELLSTTNGDRLSPEPVTIAKMHRMTSIQIRPVMRLWIGLRTDGGELVRLWGLIASYLDESADRMVLGFLNSHAGIDPEVCNALVADGDFARTFHRAADDCLDFDGVWEGLATLPCLDQVLTVGSVRGTEHGLGGFLGRAHSNPGTVQVIMTGEGLRSEHVPWLIRAGVRAFRVGNPARPGGSYEAYVDPDLVCTRRKLIDKQTAAVRRSR